MASLFESEAAQIPQLARQQFERLNGEVAPLVARLDVFAPALFATIARGSSDSAAHYLGYLAGLSLRLPAASLPPSLASVYDRTLRLDRACVLAISQSGESPDLRLAMDHARAGGALTLGLLNQGGSALASAVDVALEIGAGPELATAATKSFMLSVTAGTHLVAAWSRDAALVAALAQLAEVLAQWRADACDGALDHLEKVDDLFVVGRGPSLPIAQELALKLQEVCGIHAEAVSAAELLHGPISIAGPGRPAIVFAGDDRTGPSVMQAAGRLAQAGAPVVLLTHAGGHLDAGVQALRVPDAGHAILQPLAALYAAYPIVSALGRARGRDPDRPPHLTKITRTF